MKKLILLAAFAVLGFTTASAQGSFKIGAYGGIPVGDISDYSSFHLSFDVAYLFPVTDKVEVGPLIGWSDYFGEDYTIGPITIVGEDISFLPIAASGRIMVAESFGIGADLGYAIGLNDGNDGGFYYRPKLIYNLGVVGIVLDYQGVATDGATADSINLGVEFGF